MVNEQVMITLCSAVGCGIAIVVLSLLVTLARKIAAHHKHKAEVKAEVSKQEDAPKEKEDDKKSESADADEAKKDEKAEDSKPSNSGKKDEKADDKKDESNDAEKSDK